MIDLLDLVERNAATIPDKTAFVFEDERLSFGEFAAAVARLAGGFRAEGIGPGDRVLVAFYHGNAVAVVYFALMWIGAAPVLASASLLTDLPATVAETDPVAIVYGKEARPHLGPSIGRQLLVSADGPDGIGLPLETLREAAPIGAAPRRQDQPSGIIFSAGTTGRPKPIVRTYASDLWDGIHKLMVYRLGMQDVYLYISPLNLTALLGPIRQTLFTGATYVVIDGFDAERVAAVSARESVSQLTLLSSQWAELLELPSLGRFDLSAMRQIAAAAGQVPTALRRRIVETFGDLPFLQVYGMSEAGMIAAVQTPDPHFGESNYVGRPLSTVRVRIADEDGAPLALGEIGEIVVQTPSASAGYYRRPEASVRTFRDGWIHTGDLGRLEEGGALYLLDRASEVFTVAGRRVFPSMVQDALYALPGAQEGVLIGVPVGGETRPVAWVVPRRSAFLDETTVRTAVAAAVPFVPYDRIGVVIAPALPRTPAGKVDKGALAADWLAKLDTNER
ncbi:MAG: AMP-binding protein [Dehalococcoidia bacterium]